jgi:regulator of replication initiation timing
LKLRNVSISQGVKFAVLAALVASNVFCRAQQVASADPNSDLTDSIRDLREQVQQLRSAVAEIKSEAAQYRAENQELRQELQKMRAVGAAPQSAPIAGTANGAQTPPAQQTASSDDTTQLVQSELRTLYQTKVESASKYRVRLSGLLLLNLFHNRGNADNFDVPTWATASGPYGAGPGFGGTLRQSELGLEVFGPQLFGAKTRGEVQFDFGGGFPSGALDGINTGLVRLRTANARLDWEDTSVVAGQDSLFISPNSPTSFASLLIPSLGYSGNLWAWTPQLRVEHKFHMGENQFFSIQGGILDNVTGEPSYGSHRQPQAGESSGQPAYATRLAWSRNLNERPVVFGMSGYYSRQNWGSGWIADGWAAMGDWRIPMSSRFELSGELYRGRAVCGLGGGIGQSVLFSGNPAGPVYFLPLNSAGGWSQLKFIATSRLEFNGAFGTDNPFGTDLRAFLSPVSIYPLPLTANRSEMMNFIYRPRSDLLFSGEYRHLRTTEIGSYYSADHVNVMMGVLF